MKASVYLREEKNFVEVPITDEEKPGIVQELTLKWQTIINLIANIMHIPAGLIMEITGSHMRVFLKSSNESNPYPEGGCDKLGHGLYCETVIGLDQQLLIENALESDCWKDNPDVELNMISYLGLPIKWPDNEVFGTICVLDSKANAYSSLYSQLLEEFRNTIELDLQLLLKQKELTYYAEMDVLTETYNRRATENFSKNEFLRSSRSKDSYAVVFFDLNHFKRINDTYGHAVGDKLLITFTSAIKQRIRQTDIFGRWGGDEFVLICPNTNEQGIQNLMNTIQVETTQQIQEVIEDASFSYGYSLFDTADPDFNEIIKRADRHMYQNKKRDRSL